MITAIIMPKLGETMESGKLIKWHKKEGDLVERGDVLFEVETDKTIFEVEAPKKGFLHTILVPESDEEVPVTITVGYIAESMDEPIPEKAIEQKKAEKRPAPVVSQDKAPEESVITQVQKTGRILISPLARRLARERGLDPANIRGSGPNGRIEAWDIKSIPAEGSTIPLSQVRKITAERMTLSKTIVPHFYLFHTVDMTRALELREQLKEDLSKRYSVKLTITDIIVGALAGALREYPDMNSAYGNNGIERKERIHIGLAMASGSDLFVPVIRDADLLNISEIARQRTGLMEKTRTGKLRPDDLEGATFTLTNLGNTGLEGFIAIINPPQVGILATGSILKKPVVRNGQMGIADLMEVSLSCDHRVVNGMDAAQFLLRFIRFLEDPDTLLAGGHDIDLSPKS